MENIQKKEEKLAREFVPCVREKIIRVEYSVFNPKTDRGMYNLDIKNKGNHELCFGAVGITDFPDLVETFSRHLFSSAFNSKDRVTYSLECTPQCSKQLGPERQMVLEKIAGAYEESQEREILGLI